MISFRDRQTLSAIDVHKEISFVNHGITGYESRFIKLTLLHLYLMLSTFLVDERLSDLKTKQEDS